MRIGVRRQLLCAIIGSHGSIEERFTITCSKDTARDLILLFFIVFVKEVNTILRDKE